ncbi:TPA: hypothetical protein ACH2JC_001041 [Providencia stuartii]
MSGASNLLGWQLAPTAAKVLAHSLISYRNKQGVGVVITMHLVSLLR